MQHILIPTDFSENAWNAISYAFLFFQEREVTFHFLHIDASQHPQKNEDLHSAGIRFTPKHNSKAQAEMNLLIQKVSLLDRNDNHHFKNAIIPDYFVDGIRKYVEAHEIHLIVMGTKGASGLKEMTVGSKTGAVITKVKCPILVIPEEAKFKVPRNIGFPTDFNLVYKQKVLDTLLDITKLHNPSVKVLRVAQSKQPLDDFQNTNREYLNERLEPVEHSFHVIENPNLENGLQSFVTTMNIDMIAMIAKNLNFFQRILFKPKVATLSYHMRVPFLVLHE